VVPGADADAAAPPPASAPHEIRVGDCLEQLARIPPGTVDLVYLDPPFNTGKRQRGAAGDYEDAWPDAAAWLGFLAARLEAAIATLRPHGAIMVHGDWRTSHLVRTWLDERLGASSFVNHLVWSYGLGGSSPRRFARKHDDILYHAVGPDYWFEAPRVPARSRRLAGQTKKATDVLDIPSINNQAHERTGWPTQKPLALLELLVRAACPPGGLVVDPFCGSGTTVVAARRTGRRAIGIDVRETAAAIARERLAAEPEPASPVSS
jgi:DNA modification methylase